MNRVVFAAAMAIAGFLASAPARAATVFAMAYDGVVERYDTVTGTRTVVGDAGDGELYRGLALDEASHALYIFDTNSAVDHHARMLRMDAITGATTVINPNVGITYGDGSVVGGAYKGGNLYTLNYRSMVVFSAANGEYIEGGYPEIPQATKRFPAIPLSYALGIDDATGQLYFSPYTSCFCSQSIYTISDKGVVGQAVAAIAPTALDLDYYFGDFVYVAASNRVSLASGGTLYTSSMLGLTGVAVAESFDFDAVPEPAAWALMIAGFGLIGGAARRRRTRSAMTA